MNKALLIGTLPPPFQGQPIAFKSAVDSIGDKKKIIRTTLRSNNKLKSIFLFLKYFFDVTVGVLFFKPTHIYFLCSRTFIGSLRDIYLLCITQFSKAKLVNHLHGANFTEFYESSPWLYKKILKKLYTRVDKHIVLHNSMKEQLSCVSNEDKIFVIENFYESSADSINDEDIKKDVCETITVVYMSTIIPSKGIFETIEAVKKYHQLGGVVNLIVYGDFIDDMGMKRKEIKNKFLLSLQGCESFIEYKGVITGINKFIALAKADIFILPSYCYGEAFPLSVIEAMRMGCIIITSDYNYLPYIVKPENGYIVEPKNSNSILMAFQDITANKEKAKFIKNNNINTAKTRFTETNFRNQVKVCIFGP